MKRCLVVLFILCVKLFVFAADEDHAPIYKEIKNRHDENVQRLQEWIKLPSIAA